MPYWTLSGRLLGLKPIWTDIRPGAHLALGYNFSFVNKPLTLLTYMVCVFSVCCVFPYLLHLHCIAIKASACTSRWFVILLEFDFEVAVKKGRMHQRADHLSRITSGESPTGVDDDISDTTLFRIETAPRWSAKIIEVLTTGWVSQPSLTTESIAELETCALYKLFSGRLYRLGPKGVLRICPNQDQYDELLDYMHVNIGGFHVLYKEMVRRVLLDGYWWPTLQSDAAEFVQNCSVCAQQKPIPYDPLFHVSLTPQWSSYIVQYLTNGHIDQKLTTQRKRAIEVEARDYTIIENQLYKKGKDGNLRICVCESDYLGVLTHAHSGSGGGHFSGEQLPN